MKVTQFDKPTLRALRVQLDAHAAKIAAETGLKVSLGKCNFTQGEATFALTLNIEGAITRDGLVLQANASYLGLPANVLGRTLKLRDGEFTVTGLRRTKLTLRRISDGKDGFTFGADDAKKIFDREDGNAPAPQNKNGALIAALLARNNVKL